jgi:4-amino-4-deoxy-L-arabinose transferase-like glycosyltransferase
MRLVLILLAGLALRLAYLIHVTSLPGFHWHDPDFYVRGALRLASGVRGWHWSFDAVSLSIGERPYVVPPLYTVFLSIFAPFSHFPFTAQLVQLGLAVVAIVLVFDLGRVLHSVTAGLIAAGGYAIWAPNILNVWSTSQEALYVPLVLLGFVLFARALATGRSPQRFLWAGVAFGFAALTRSMPLFFVPLAAALHVALSAHRRNAIRQAALLLAGLALPTVPYIVALSLHVGQFTPIDSHGSIHVASQQGDTDDDRALSVSETVAALARTIAAAPIEYLGACAERARSLVHVNGGRVLQIYVAPETKAGAWMWKIALHASIDLLFIVALILAPFGVAFSRDRRVAFFLVVWIVVNIAVASAGGFGGARLRAPFEPVLLVFAAVVLSGAWRRPRRPWLVFAAIGSLGLALVTLPQLPRSFRSWPSYGVAWSKPLDRESGRLREKAGFNVLAGGGTVGFTLKRRSFRSEPNVARVRVRFAGREAEAFEMGPRESRECRYPWAERDLVFVEVEAESAPNAQPVRLAVVTR